jgi:uncharacterized protein YaaN involved in tellurite resistance
MLNDMASDDTALTVVRQLRVSPKLDQRVQEVADMLTLDWSTMARIMLLQQTGMPLPPGIQLNFKDDE